VAEALLGGRGDRDVHGVLVVFVRQLFISESVRVSVETEFCWPGSNLPEAEKQGTSVA